MIKKAGQFEVKVKLVSPVSKKEWIRRRSRLVAIMVSSAIKEAQKGKQ